MGTVYYYINDMKIVAKEEDYTPYIYKKKDGWVVDNDNILSDRLMGYDEDSIGNSDMLFRVEKITEQKAMELISNM